MLTAALTATPIPTPVLEEIAAALPFPTFALAGTAAEVFQQLAAGTAPGGSERAGWLLDLSNYLGALGRLEEALAVTEEAVTTYRALAQARPDAFGPNLAASLNTQSVFLAELGRREEALAAIEEAVTTYRALAQARPAVFADSYASSLEAQAAILSELGAGSEAKAVQQEAAAIRAEIS